MAIPELTLITEDVFQAKGTEQAGVIAAARANAVADAKAHTDAEVATDRGRLTSLEAKVPARGILPANADLNLYISPSAHVGLWATSGANNGTVLNKPTGYENDQGTYQVIGAGNGAVSQLFYPYAKNVVVRRTLTNTSGATWTAWEVTDAKQDAAIAALDTRVTAAESAGYIDSDPTAPLESVSTTIDMWGDSLTMADGVAARLRALLPGVTVTNRGVSGQTAGQIAARQGGVHSRLTVTADTIPASGPVAVTARTESLLAQTGYPVRSETGRLSGVAGTLTNGTVGSIAYTFTRTTAGDTVPCPPWDTVHCGQRQTLQATNPDHLGGQEQHGAGSLAAGHGHGAAPFAGHQAVGGAGRNERARRDHGDGEVQAGCRR
jgi:hypothetical protein